MKELSAHFKSGKLYHAYCIAAEVAGALANGVTGAAHIAGVVPKLKEFFEKELGFKTIGNPDFHHISKESFGIEDSRRLKELHLSKPVGTSGLKIFIIETNSMTHEAQNSLLKVFEEPQEGVHFFIVVPSLEILLPTLRSRLMVITAGDNSDLAEGVGVSNDEARTFLKLPIKEKIKFVDDLAAAISDEKATKQSAIVFLNNLESFLAEDLRKSAQSNQSAVQTIQKRRSLEAALKARDYIQDRSPSVKQLLEFVALSV